MQNDHCRPQNILSNAAVIMPYIPLAVLMAVVLILSLHMHWQGDAVAFQYFVPLENEDFSSIPLNNVGDIWFSMCNHWHNSTGRFFAHFIVQLFCAFIGKTGFAICNSIVWGGYVLMLLKLANVRKAGFTLMSFASLLTFLLFFPINDFAEQSFPFEPPHQINYVWMGLLNMGWIYFFLKNCNKKFRVWGLGLLILFSFLGGQANESFSVPIGGAILIYAVARRFKMSLCQYLMAISYGIGAIFVIFAPGNFHRLGEGGAFSALHVMERLLPSLLIPVIWFVTYLYTGNKEGNAKFSIIYNSPFLISVILINYVFSISLGMGSGSRMLTCANSFVLVFALLNLRKIGEKAWIAFLSIGLLFVTGMIRYHSITVLNNKNRMIERLYHESEDGIVVLPDGIFLKQAREFIVRPHPYMMQERAVDPYKPNIAIRPESMTHMDLDMDTNRLVRLSDQAWLMIQSRKRPADFVIEKTILPGMLDRKMTPRPMDWNDHYSVFDSTDLWRTALYINERPFLHSDVKMVLPESK